MPCFRLDPLHPSALLCADCGEFVARVGTDGPAELHGLTANQAVRVWPDHAEAIRRHEVLCTWRRNPPRWGSVYFHLTPREGE
jgi:hypothetical protein